MNNNDSSAPSAIHKVEQMTLAEFWRLYPFPEAGPECTANYCGFHPLDLEHLKTYYPHYFDDPEQYAVRKRNEIEKFQYFSDQVHGHFGFSQTGELIRSKEYTEVAVPDHYHGNLKEAKLLILLVNPLYTPGLVHTEAENRMILKNLQDDNSRFAPCEFVEDQFNLEHKIGWWRDNMYQPLNDSVERHINPNELMSLEYTPYRTMKRKDVPLFKNPLPSQIVSFNTVRAAMDKGIHIIMRGTEQRGWMQYIPELKNYPNLFVFTNFKNPSLLKSEVMSYKTYMRRALFKTREAYMEVHDADWERFIAPFKER